MINPLNPTDEDQPKEVTIKKAEGGFIITKHGGDTGFHETPIVTTKEDFDNTFAKCKKWLLK